MSINGQTQQGSIQPAQQHARTGRNIEEIIDVPLESADVPPGQYPALFVGFGDKTVRLPSKFATAKRSKDGMVEKMNAIFAVRVGESSVRALAGLVSPPTAAGLSSMSNLYKFLKVLGAGDSGLWDGSIDSVKRGTKLSSFIGKTSMVVVGKDKNGFAKVVDLVMAPAGVPISFPSADEAQAALDVFQHSGEAEASLPADDGDVPF